MNIKESVKNYKSLEKEIYLHLFLEAVRSTWNNGRFFTVTPWGIDDHGGEGLEGLEDLTSNSLKLLFNIDELLKASDLPEYGLISEKCYVDKERLEMFLDKAFGFDNIDPNDYMHLI